MARKNIDLKRIKKAVILIIVSVTIILCAIIAFLIANTLRIGPEEYTGAIITFKYDGANIKKDTNENELVEISKILSGKLLYKDDLKCGFSEDISVKLTGKSKNLTLLIARDACPILYVKEADRYIKLTEKEANKLRKILCEYGMTFPCI